MNTFQVLGVLFLFASLTTPLAVAQDGTTCTIPDSNKQSICVRLHLCDAFNKILVATAGRPSTADAQNIRKHVCSGNFVCCPDNAKEATTTTTTKPTNQFKPTSLTTVEVKNLPELPSRNDLTAVRNHRNFPLLNIKCGTGTSKRIVGGENATLGEFPWMALLQYKSRLDETLSFNCGGSLITANYVLTAGHCINRDLVAVRLGEYDQTTEIDCEDPSNQQTCQEPVQDIPVDKTMRQENYSNRLKINDIALVRLMTPADITKRNVRNICVPTEANNQIDKLEAKFSEKMLIAGWGQIENGKTSKILQKGTVPYVTKSQCAQKFDGFAPVYSTYLCAGGRNKTDTCHGDSGGGIQTYGMVDGKVKMILYGVVSVGVQCLNPDVIYPGIYTDIAFYLTWILDNIAP